MPTSPIGSGLEKPGVATLRRALRIALSLAAGLLPPGAAEAVRWTSQGPNGGVVLALAADPTTPSRFYAATNGGGFFRSADAGASWVAIDTGVPGVARFTMTGLSVDRLNPSRLYATGIEAPVGGGVFKSTNGGDSWSYTPLGFLYDVATAADPSAPNTVYAVGGDVFRSLDAGATWTTQVEFGNFITVAVDPTAPRTVYVGGTGGGIMKSTDGGTTWAWKSAGLGSDSVDAIAVHPTGVVYAGGDQDGVYKSTNGGDSWTSIGPLVAGGNLWVTDLAVDPSNPNVVYAAGFATGGFGVYKTTNGGATWSSTPLGETAFSLALSPAAPAVVVAGTGDGAWRSSDGAGSWKSANTGLVNRAIQSLATTAQPGRVYAGGTNGKVYRSDDEGRSWLPNAPDVGSNTMSGLAVDPTNADVVYAGGYAPDGVFKSTNGGATWSPLSTGDPPITGYALVVDPTSPAIVYAAAFGGVYRSTQGGDNWVLVSNGLYPLPVSLVIDPAAPGTLYAGAAANPSSFPGVFKTTNGGGLWSPVNTGLPNVPDTNVAALALDPNTGAVYAGLEGVGVYKTIDGGTSWTPLNAGLTNLDVTALRVDPELPDTVYAGTRGGVFRSVGGAAWVAIDDGLYNPWVMSLAATGPGRVLAGSGGNGVFFVTACSDGVDDDGDGLFDHPADPGCASASADLEDPQCDDDLDNDGDGRVDWNGAPGGVPADPHCTQPSRNRETPSSCGLGFELALVLPPVVLWRRRRRTR
jgi:photosystem II stability/assembly factor-like uncharacterized protein